MRSLKINKCRFGNIGMKRKKEFSLILAVFSLAIFSTGCSDESYVDPTDSGNQFTLNITLQAPGLSGRAGTVDKIKATDAETYINIGGNDYAVFLLDQDGKYLQQFEPGQVSIQQTPTGQYEYHLSGVFQRPAEDVKEIKLLVLANWRNKFGGSYNSVDDFLADKKSLEDLYTESESFNFTLPKASDGSAWTPDGSTDGIPMVGLSTAVAFSKENQVINLNDPVQMLRSLAKIEIVDKAPGEGAKIEKCVLTGYNTSGRFIPDGEENPYWNDTDKQVVSPSLPMAQESMKLGKDLIFTTSTREVVPNKETEAQERQVYSVYIPEMLLQDGSRPKIEISIKGSSKTYEIELASYDKTTGKPTINDDGTTDYYTHLLRNHIYRYNINAVNNVNAELDLLIDTDKWDNDEDEYYYDDLTAEFTSGGKFKWNWDYDNIDSQDPVFSKLLFEYDDVMKWSKEQLQSWKGRNLIVQRSGDSGAEATFTISKPERGTWTLALYCEEGTPNHWFQIEIWDEESGKWILQDQRIDDNEHNLIADTLSGAIAPKGKTPTEVKIRISATDLQYSGGVYKARLIMNVTTFDGRMTEIDLINSEMYPSNAPDSDKEYYYILQYPTPKE